MHERQGGSVSLLLSASLKMILRDYQAIFWALAFPMLFLGVFRLFAFDAATSTDLIVAADPATERGAALVTALESVDFLELSIEPDLDEAGARVALEDDADVVLLASDAPLGETASVLMLHGLSDPIGSAMTLAAIESVVGEVNLALMEQPVPFEVTVQSLDVRETTYFQFLAPGIIGMGLMTFATISLAGSLSRYREEGVLRRIRATPLPPWRFFSSVVGAHLVVAFVQIVVLVAVAQALGGDVLRGVAGLVFIAMLGTLIFLNIGVIIAGRVRSRGGVEGAANAVTLPMMFLSGAFFPVSTLPSAIQPLVEFLPLTPMLRAMRAITLDGEAFTAQWPELLILVAWVAGTFLAARFAFSLRDA